MEINKLITTIEGSVSRMKLKEITQAVENLKSNCSTLALFLKYNNVGDIDFDVASYLLTTTTELIGKRIPLNLVANVYSQYSIIFAINALISTSGKSEKVKINKIFVDVLSNSAKFDVYMKVVKNLKKVSSSDSIVLEVFWLIPLFSNTKVLVNLDYNKFISEMKKIIIKNPEYVVGYEYFVFSNIARLDKVAYKQFLKDGMLELQASN